MLLLLLPMLLPMLGLVVLVLVLVLVLLMMMLLLSVVRVPLLMVVRHRRSQILRQWVRRSPLPPPSCPSLGAVTERGTSNLRSEERSAEEQPLALSLVGLGRGLRVLPARGSTKSPQRERLLLPSVSEEHRGGDTLGDRRNRWSETTCETPVRGLLCPAIRTLKARAVPSDPQAFFGSRGTAN